jgi:hypothetical protein
MNQEYRIFNEGPIKGYATAIYGKWHLGRLESGFPTHFDEWYGIPRSYDEAL